MTDLLAPTTDAGVWAQLAVVSVVFAVLVWLARRRVELRLMLIGLWLTTYGMMGLRALH